MTGQMKTTNLNRMDGLLAKVYRYTGRQIMKARYEYIDDCSQSVQIWSPLARDNIIVITE
jgi:hypothetical protein